MKATSLLGMCLLTFTSMAQIKDLGQIDFPNSGSKEAQKDFITGVLLLHSFEYEDAREAFQAAQKIDPDFAMAYWGEAMTHNHPVWFRQYREKGEEALNKLGDNMGVRITKAKTPKEQIWITAVSTLFSDKGTKEERDFQYSKLMGEFYKQFPEDQEIASFYALSIIGTSHKGRDIPIYMRAAEIVEKVYALNPNHPGALHYLIHAYDDPGNATKGLNAAKNYSVVAPAASHALHMPTHIFYALGMWDEMVKGNEESFEAADARKKRKGLSLEARGYHAFWWLQYGYLQQGRFEKALDLLKEMEADAKESGSRRTRYHHTMMRAHYIVETDNWTSKVLKRDPDITGLYVDTYAADRFIIGMSAIKGGEVARAKEVLDEMLENRRYNTANKLDFDFATCHVGGENFGKLDPEEQAAAIMESMLEASIMLEEGYTERAYQMLDQATEAEDNMVFIFGPPSVVKPSHELFGEVLLEANRYSEAREHFEKALLRAPKRMLSLRGLYRANRGLGDESSANAVQTMMKEIRHSADEGVYPQSED